MPSKLFITSTSTLGSIAPTSIGASTLNAIAGVAQRPRADAETSGACERSTGAGACSASAAMATVSSIAITCVGEWHHAHTHAERQVHLDSEIARHVSCRMQHEEALHG